MMIDDMHILQISIYGSWLQHALIIIGILGFLLFLCISVILFITDTNKQHVKKAVICVIASILFLITIFLGAISMTIHPYYTYKVLIDENTQLNSIIKNYRIISQKDNQLTICDKDQPIL